MQYIKSKHYRAQCPVAGIQIYRITCITCSMFRLLISLNDFVLVACPKMLETKMVIADAFLQIEIDELRKTSRHSGRIQDFTELDAD